MTTSLNSPKSPRNARRAAAYSLGRRHGISDVEIRYAEEQQAQQESAAREASWDVPVVDFATLARQEVLSWGADSWEEAAQQAGAHSYHETGRADRTSYYRGYAAGVRQALRELARGRWMGARPQEAE